MQPLHTISAPLIINFVAGNISSVDYEKTIVNFGSPEDFNTKSLQEICQMLPEEFNSNDFLKKVNEVYMQDVRNTIFAEIMRMNNNSIDILKFDRKYDSSELTLENVRKIYVNYMDKLKYEQSKNVTGFNCYDIPFEVFPWLNSYKPPFKILDQILNNTINGIVLWNMAHKIEVGNISEKYSLSGGASVSSSQINSYVIYIVIAVVGFMIIVSAIIIFSKNNVDNIEVEGYIVEY
jgi:hypothetical protein